MIAVITTFSTGAWDIYAKEFVESFTANWPEEISLLIQLDNDQLLFKVKPLLRNGDGLNIGIDEEHKNFIEKYKDKDDHINYRKQAVRFCHKVFAIKHALDAVRAAKKDGMTPARYLIWLDADVTTHKKITMDDVKKWLPKEGDAVSYFGRKDWDHSECGFMAFDLDAGGDALIDKIVDEYTSGHLFSLPQWHDSYIFDVCRAASTNLTPDAKGRDIWSQSPLGEFTVHHKGPIAKSRKTNNAIPLKVDTKNSRPNEEIKNNIRENQKLIKNWVQPCKKVGERIAVVSAGPQLIAENVLAEVKRGVKVVAVKHALKHLKAAGITPWACILLDPRPRVNAFVENPDKNILWFVASQVEPDVTKKLLNAGCTVWGYHAAVGANEEELTQLQPDAIISGGSATSTRGLFLLDRLGFTRFNLYGYDLCVPGKPDLNEKDELGQPKYFEIEINVEHPRYKMTKGFWTMPELIAQYQEMNDIFQKDKWDIKAFGHGIIPFMSEAKEVSHLRTNAKKDKLVKTTYRELLSWKTNSPTPSPRGLPKNPLQQKKVKPLSRNS